jgi:hypothetical protein
MEQPLSFNSLIAIPKSCVYSEFPNGVGKDQPHILWFSIVHFKSFAGWQHRLYFYEETTHEHKRAERTVTARAGGPRMVDRPAGTA